MSVNGPNKDLKLKVSFQEPFIDTSKTGKPISSEELSKILSGQFSDDKKGLTVQDVNNENAECEYYPNGMIKTKIITDPETNQIAKKINYSELGAIINESIYTEDGVEDIYYGPDDKTHIFKNKEETKILSRISYDTKQRIKSIGTYDPDSGNIIKDETFNPETEKLETLAEYNDKGMAVKFSQFSDKYPAFIYEYEYNEQNIRTKAHHLNEKNEKLDTTYYNPETGLPEKRTYYKKDGSVSEEYEIYSDGTELEPVVSALKKDFSTGNIKKLNVDNIIKASEQFEKVFNSSLAEEIFSCEYPDEETRTEQLNHIFNTLKDKFSLERKNSLELYCGDEETVNKGIDFITKEIDSCMKSKYSSIQDAEDTFEIAVNMIKNSDYFIDKANGKLDKTYYQGDTGDCWLLAALGSIADSDAGKKLIEKRLKADKKTGDVTVELGNKKKYTVTHKELLKSSRFSKGDYDMRAFECAFEKYFKEKSPRGRTDLNGNSPSMALMLLTGNYYETYPEIDNNGDLGLYSKGEFIPVNKKTKKEFKNQPMKILNSEKAFDALEKLQPDIAICCSAMTSEYSAHAYWIKINGDQITVKEAHNSKNEKIYTREEFLERFTGGLSVLIL